MDQVLNEPGLPRDISELTQRERLLWSMARAIAEKGYDGVTVADVVGKAGVSRSTFYDEFANKDECMFASYDLVVEVLVKYVSSAYESEESWPAKIRVGLDAFLRALAAEPDVARMATVEVPGAGPEAHRRYREAIERFQPFFKAGRDYAELGAELPPDVELMAVGGAEAIIFDEVIAGRVSKLPGMMPDILFAVLVPYLGPDEAAEEMRRAETAAG